MHAPDHRTHNQRLHAVMKRLRESGLTLNPAKGQFSIDRLNFMGILPMQKWIGHTEEESELWWKPENHKTPLKLGVFLDLLVTAEDLFHNLQPWQSH